MGHQENRYSRQTSVGSLSLKTLFVCKWVNVSEILCVNVFSKILNYSLPLCLCHVLLMFKNAETTSNAVKVHGVRIV